VNYESNYLEKVIRALALHQFPSLIAPQAWSH